MQSIHFGTSGWRDIIADGFTFDKVTALTRAVAGELKRQRLAARGVIVGHDYRFLAEEFAEHTVRVLSREGIPVVWVKEAVPTPALALAIRELKLAGGVNFTASHNPAGYQGYKWSNQHGSPATKEEVAPIEAAANRLLASKTVWPAGKKNGAIREFDPKPGYFKQLAKMVDFSLIRPARISVVADPLFGAGRGYLDHALRAAGCEVEVLHDWRDVLFGGGNPEPDADRMREAGLVMRKKDAVLALGTDGDADRFGVVDRDGTHLTPNQVLALTVYLLAKHRGWKGRVVRSVVTSHLVDAVAQKYHLPTEITPVGFKYIGESMQRGGFLAGGEESGGLTVAGHVPEKDGILACLLMTELVAREKKSLKAILSILYKTVGTILSDRLNLHLDSSDAASRIRTRLERHPLRSLAGQKVVKVETMDGYKYVLEDGSWLAVRLSGTEPVARVYVESRTQKRLEQLIREGRTLLLEC